MKKQFFLTAIMLVFLGFVSARAGQATFQWDASHLTAFSGTADGIQFATGTTGSASACAYNATNGLVLYGVNSGGGYFYTTTPTEGDITTVTITANAKKNTPKYTVYGSTDGSSWTQVGEQKPVSSNTTDSYDFSGQGYKYVKVHNTTDATAQLGINKIVIDFSSDVPVIDPHTVTLVPGAGSVASTTLTESVNGAGVLLPTPSITIADWTFAGWSDASCAETTTVPAILIAAGSYVPEGDITLYAVYKKTESVGGGSQTYLLTNDEIATARQTNNNPSGYNTYTVASAGGDWSGKFMFNANGGVIALQINKNANNYHLTSPEYPGGVTSVTIDTSGNASTASGRKFYIRSSDTTAQPTAGDLGEGSLSEAKGTVKIDVNGSPNQFYIYSDGTAYINNISVTTGASAVTTYNSNPEPEEDVDVTGVTLSDSSLTLTVGETATLTATVEPADATNKTITWASSNEGVASVANGTVTAVAPGSATITVTTEDGGKTAECLVTVNPRTFTLTYDANGGEGSIESQSADEGTTLKVAAGDALSKSGHTFSGWNTAANGSGDEYAADADLTLNGNITLYAQWIVNTYTVTYNANGGQGVMSDPQSPYTYGSTVTILPADFSYDGYVFDGWNTEADGSGDAYVPGATFTISGDVTLYAQWKVRGTEFTIFHEGFGNNSNSARDWQDSYKEQSGMAEVYANAVYAMENARQSKNNVGSTNSGLAQSSTSSDAIFTVGPLDLSAFADGTEVTLSYKWKAGSTKGTYSTTIYYSATGTDDSYVEIPNDAVGATTFVDVAVKLPSEALVSTAYLRVVFKTSNTQAIIDEFDLQGKQSKRTPVAYFDLPIHYVYANDAIDLPEHVSLSNGAVTHVSADESVALIVGSTLNGGSAHGTLTVVTATIAETDEHTSATASYMVKVVPAYVTVNLESQLTPFSNQYHLDFSEVADVDAYVVTKFEEDPEDGATYAILEKVENGIVPAKNGVVLVAAANDEFEVPVLLDANTIDKDNYLVGALQGTVIPVSDDSFARFTFDNVDNTYVRLTASSPAPGASRANGGEATEDTAYIELPAAAARTLPDTMALRIGNGEATDLENIIIVTERDGLMYNIWGQRVNDNYRGYIIIDGVKFIRK